ncbi:MAG TPA: tetratricopeptide repeat protein [Candidatus Sumerlaeota bacterium]|nr:tetratricopeptide repeat protein [Candidatus Sumerlaeota bacterium]
MRPLKSKLSWLFTFLVFLHLPVALLCAILIYAGMLGSISGAKVFGIEGFSWFEPVETYFGVGASGNFPLRIVYLIAYLAGEYILLYVLSFFCQFYRRPFFRLLPLHEHVALPLASTLLVFLDPDLPSLPGFLALLAVVAVLPAWPLAAWFAERAVGRLITRMTLNAMEQNRILFGKFLLAIALKFCPTDKALQRTLGFLKFQKGDFEDALSLLEPLLTKDSTEIPLLDALDICYQKAERWEDSLAIERRLLELDPEGRMETRLHVAGILDRMGNVEEAIRVLRECMPVENMEYLDLLVSCLIKASDYSGAVDVVEEIERIEDDTHKKSKQAYRSILEAAPQHVEALERLAALLILQGDTQEGFRCLEKIVTLEPDRLDLRKSLVAYYQEIGQMLRAEPHLEALIDAGQDSKDIALLYGDILFEREDYERALTHFQYAVENYPDDYRFAYFLAQIHLNTQSLEEATRWANESLLRAHTEEAKQRLRIFQKRVQEALGDRDLQMWQERVKRDPGNIEIRLGLVEAYAKANQPEAVVAECESFLEQYPAERERVGRLLETLTMDSAAQHFRLLDYLSDLKIKARRWDEALEIARRMASLSMDSDKLFFDHCRRILRLQPDHLPSLRNLAEIAYRSKDWAQTLDAYERLREMDPACNKDECLRIICEAATQTGDTGKAIEAGETLLAKRPQDMNLLLQLIRLYASLKEYDEAFRYLETAQSIDYYHTEVVKLRRQMEVDRREYRLAQVAKLLEEDPLRYPIQMEAGDLYSSAGQIKKAITCYQLATRDPQIKNLASAKLALAMCRLRMFDLAEETLEEVSLKTGNPDEVEQLKALVYEVAEAFQEDLETERALKLYKKIFRVDAAFREVVDKIEALGETV